MDLNLVPGGSFQARCDSIFEEVAGYCKSHGLTLHMAGLTKTILGCATSAEFPTASLGFARLFS